MMEPSPWCVLSATHPSFILVRGRFGGRKDHGLASPRGRAGDRGGGCAGGILRPGGDDWVDEPATHPGGNVMGWNGARPILWTAGRRIGAAGTQRSDSRTRLGRGRAGRKILTIRIAREMIPSYMRQSQLSPVHSINRARRHVVKGGLLMSELHVSSSPRPNLSPCPPPR